MSAIYSISEGKGRQWCISLDRELLLGELRLGSAINLARNIARADHDTTGRGVRVEFLAGEAPVVLARYGTQ